MESHFPLTGEINYHGFLDSDEIANQCDLDWYSINFDLIIDGYKINKKEIKHIYRSEISNNNTINIIKVKQPNEQQFIVKLESIETNFTDFNCKQLSILQEILFYEKIKNLKELEKIVPNMIKTPFRIKIWEKNNRAEYMFGYMMTDCGQNIQTYNRKADIGVDHYFNGSECNVNNIKNIDILCLQIKQLITNIMCMHSHGIYHLDIKSDNIMVKSTGSIYFIDFGRCQTNNYNQFKKDLRYLDDSNPYLVFGTPGFQALEILTPGKYFNQEMTDDNIKECWVKMDLFALGCTIVDMMFRFNFS